VCAETGSSAAALLVTTPGRTNAESAVVLLHGMLCMWLSAACKMAGSSAQADFQRALELTCLKAPALAAVLHVRTARGLGGAGTMLL
jgi:uncharacterized membrane protein YhdT